MGSFPSLYLPAAPPAASKATQTEWNCPVCHSVHSDTVAVPCGHQFCLGCLLRHTATSATCPRCASPVLSARFSVLGRGDFLQCILSPPGSPPGPAGWARRALFRLVHTRPPGPPAAPGPAEPRGGERFPAGLWAELLHGHEHLLDPVRPWLRQSLDAIYGPQWWEARQVESIALSTLCICGPDRAGLTHMLQGYLGEYAAPLIHGLIHVTRHRCRDAWLRRRRSRDGPEQQQQEEEDEEEEGESPAVSAGPSPPGGTLALGLALDPAGPGLRDQPSEPEPDRTGGPGHPPAAPGPAGQDQPWPGPEHNQPWPGPDQNQPWPGPEQNQPWPGTEQNQPWPGPEQNQPWPAPQQHQFRAGPEQNQPRRRPEQRQSWSGPQQQQPLPRSERPRPRSEQRQPRAGPQEDAASPGPSTPRRGRNRRPRVARRSRRSRGYKCRRPWTFRRKPRRR